jgi:hypothetical protein
MKIEGGKNSTPRPEYTSLIKWDKIWTEVIVMRMKIFVLC